MDDEIGALCPFVPEWRVQEEGGIKRLDRTFKVRNFIEAMHLAQSVGKAAEEERHHPRLTVDWGRLNVQWWTHKIGGLHRNDFVMAARTDAIYARAT